MITFGGKRAGERIRFQNLLRKCPTVLVFVAVSRLQVVTLIVVSALAGATLMVDVTLVTTGTNLWGDIAVDVAFVILAVSICWIYRQGRRWANETAMVEGGLAQNERLSAFWRKPEVIETLKELASSQDFEDDTA